MNFGRGNFFDDNRRSFGNFDSSQPSSFSSRGFSNSTGNFGAGSGITRQRSPLFNERDHFESQMPSNFPSFSNRNFGYPQQQQQQQPTNDSSKVYHVPIHIEQDDGQSNSYIKISEPSGYQTNQQPQNNYPGNYQQQRQPNNNYFQSNPAEQMHFDRSHSPSNRAPSPFYNTADANHLNDFRDRSEQEFKRQSEELFKRRSEEARGASANRGPSTGNQGNEYRIPIRIENDNDSSNLARDFNKMHCPSAVRTAKPGQKNSTPTGEFVNSKDFNNVPASYQQQPQFNQQNSHHFDQQQQQNNPAQQQQRPAQQPKKPASPMAIVQDILEEVEKYEHEVDYFQGVYQDKQWKYLDEYLTRCMLKLDTIDACGDMNLKQARKNALNYINKVIAKLENIEKAQSEKKTDEKAGEKAGEDASKQGETNKMEQDEAGKGATANDESNKEDANRPSQPEAAVKEDESKIAESTDDQKKESDNPKADAKSKEKSDKKAKNEEKKAEKKKASKKPDDKDKKKKIKKDETDQNREN